MRVTRKAIDEAIKEKTGYDVHIYNGGGYFYFYSDDDETALMLAKLNTASVYVYTLGVYSVEEWVAQFEYLLEDLW